ncbi:hypothetical protein SK128_020013 [Halocaridina rubra]|uniref:Uncharacterized protein n=1 Tax=Halocaridina rubra TaxID=373956 RepID=A0AAN8XHG2_HALRR
MGKMAGENLSDSRILKILVETVEEADIEERVDDIKPESEDEESEDNLEDEELLVDTSRGADQALGSLQTDYAKFIPWSQGAHLNFVQPATNCCCCSCRSWMPSGSRDHHRPKKVPLL